jgi:Fic family protein
MKTLGHILSELRQKKQLLSRDVAAAIGIDAAMVSRFEKGSRVPSRRQVMQLASIFQVPPSELLVPWMTGKVLREIGNDPLALDALALAEAQVLQLREQQPAIIRPFKKLLSEIDTLKKELDMHRVKDNYRLAEALAIEYTFESNKIEGNTLTLQETALVINDGITVSGKTMREHLEAINHYEAIAFIKEIVQKKTLFSEKYLLQLHHLVLRGIDPENAGVYRRIQVRISGSDHLPPEPYLVPKLMEELFLWFEQNSAQLHPVVLAAEMHERLVSIHPFIDGNGRTSRLLMNLILLQHGYVIANIRGDKNARLKYYDALESSRKDPAKVQFISLIAETELQGLRQYISYLK